MPKSSHHHLNHIKRFRMEKGLTQRDLARIIGYQSVSSLSHLENGHKLPSIKTAMKLEVAFQRLIPDIFPKLYETVREPVARRRGGALRYFSDERRVFKPEMTYDYDTTSPSIPRL